MCPGEWVVHDQELFGDLVRCETRPGLRGAGVLWHLHCSNPVDNARSPTIGQRLIHPTSSKEHSAKKSWCRVEVRKFARYSTLDIADNHIVQ
jgi:hypothetical protein